MKNSNLPLVILVLALVVAFNLILDHTQQPRPLTHPCRVVQDTQGHQYVGQGCRK